MKITVSVGGKFHAFHLAEELYKRGHLHKLITTYFSPTRNAKGVQVDRRRVVTNLLPEIAMRLPQKVPGIKNYFSGEYYKSQLFDIWARKQIDHCDIVVGFAAFSLHTLRAAKAYGAITIIERGSAHILFQKEILEDEYQKHGIKSPPINEDLLVKQLWEYGEADYISVLSDFSRRSFLERGVDPQKIIYVPCGTDLTHFKPVPKTDNVFRIIHIGGSFQKGTLYLLEAVYQLRLKNFELFLIGGIEEALKPFLKKYKSYYRHIGKVPHSELYKYYSQGSVYVLPSLQDGWAMAVTEAMACGLPVILTPNTGTSEIIRDGQDGFIIPIRDTEELKEKILYLYEHEKECKAMGESALKRVQEFTWDRYGEKICQAYDKVLEHKRKSKKDSSKSQEFYNYLWEISDVWQSCGNWSDKEYNQHFKDIFDEKDIVLDVGCGDMRAYQERVMSSVKELYGVDISEKAISRAQQKGLKAFIQDLGKPLQFEDETFDKVICLEVLEHLFDPMFAVREIWRVLKPNGLLVLSVPNVGYFQERLMMLMKAEVPAGITDYSNPWMGPHIRFFNRRILSHLLDCCGFEIQRVKSKGDCSIFDVLNLLGAPGRYLARVSRVRLPRIVRLGFLGNLWPSLFAPNLLVIARKLKCEYIKNKS